MATNSPDYRNIADGIMKALSDIALEPRPHFRVLPTPRQSDDPRLWDVDERNSVGFIIEDRGGSGGPYRTHVVFKVRTGVDTFVEISFVVEATPIDPNIVKEMKVGGKSVQFNIGKGRPLKLEIPVMGGLTPKSIDLTLIKNIKENVGSNQILFKIANQTKRTRTKDGNESFDFGTLLDLNIYEESDSPIITLIDEIKGYGLLPESENRLPKEIHFKDYFIASTRIPHPKPGNQTISELSELLSEKHNVSLDISIMKYVQEKIEKKGGRLYDFQDRAILAIVQELAGDRRPCMVTARTAAGKTEAFLIPIINFILGDNSEKRKKGIKAVFFYPTKALASDQLQRIVELLYWVNQSRVSDPLTLGVYHGDVEESLSLDIPLPVRCVLHEQDIQTDKLQPSDVRLVPEQGSMTLKCKRCNEKYPFLMIDRSNVTLKLPDILIATPDAINYVLMKNDRRHVFFGASKTLSVCSECHNINKDQSARCEKCNSSTTSVAVKPEVGPSIVVLDELHLFNSLFGGNVSSFLKRLSIAISTYNPSESKEIQFVATSATIRNPMEFGQDFFGKPAITVETAEEDYDFENGFSKVIVFTAPKAYRMIDTVSYSLYEILRSTDTRFLVFVDSRKLCGMLLSTLRQRLSADSTTEKLVEQVDGHNSSYTRQERAETEERFNAGKIRVLVATSTLEVGVDFKNLDGLAIYGAPYGFNSYLQRIGRAGRRNDAIVINFLSSSDPIDIYYYRNAARFAKDPTQFVEQPPFPISNVQLIQKHVLATLFDASQILGVDIVSILKAFKEDTEKTDARVLSHVKRIWRDDNIAQASARLKAATTAVMNDSLLPDATIKKFNLMNLRKVDETIKVEFEEPISSGSGRPGSHQQAYSGGSRGSGSGKASGTSGIKQEEKEILRKMRGGA
jgi:superfamily II DNA/RNA helicase